MPAKEVRAMPKAYSPTFALNVTTGLILTVLGALLGLAAGIWYMRAGEWAHREARPLGFRALSAAAFIAFVVGLFWQLLGYLRLEYAAWW